MGQITSREKLEEWLKDKPVDWAQVIAARAALRMMAYAFGRYTDQQWVIKHASPLIRSVAILWAARSFPAYDMLAATAAVARISFAQTTSSSASIAYSATTAASVDTSKTLASVHVVASAATYAASAINYMFPVVWKNIDFDCAWLVDKRHGASAASRLAHEKLWPVDDSETLRQFSETWSYVAKCLASFKDMNGRNQNYQVWIDWYNRRIEGHDAAFDIPGDIDRKEDKAILARLADATDEDFWGKGATYINTTLQGWIDEARERVLSGENPDEPSPPTPEAIRAAAAEIASPSVTLTNNQLDVIANTAFDSQTDAANLDEAIAVLRAVVGALLKSLDKDLPRNGNVPYSFTANLTIYDGELAKRDAKPFLGVLVRMEKSVSAGFHADPDMFDVGVTTNFESYFDAHLAFMTHYRRNEEREAKIAQFTIDDAAASGVALTGPVDEVVKEVDALAEQGLVTDGFVQAIKEQKAINDEVALYTSSVPAKSGEPAVKERHILQTVGFYERTLAIASNAITVAKPLIAFIKILKEAIEALLKFFV